MYSWLRPWILVPPWEAVARTSGRRCASIRALSRKLAAGLRLAPRASRWATVAPIGPAPFESATASDDGTGVTVAFRAASVPGGELELRSAVGFELSEDGSTFVQAAVSVARGITVTLSTAAFPTAPVPPCHDCAVPVVAKPMLAPTL